MKTLYKKGSVFGNWTLISLLGGGGNGEVWRCQSSKGDIKAIKILKKIKKIPYNRFVDETIIIEKNSDISGIIPIEDKYLPDTLIDQIPFFVMPLGESSEIILQGKSIEEKIEAIIHVAETLSELHKRKIYHRDIKPPNILFYNSRFSLVDFGLVDYPNKKEVSVKNEEIGAKWTMAPEMKRESSTADLAKADIYSLAKTLWIYLTENTKGFDGQYSTDSIIHLKKFYPQSYTSPIDNLRIACTDNDPSKRPSITDFIQELKDWKQLEEDFHERNQEQWFEIQTKLFPTSVPSRVIWETVADIVKVLKVVCSFDNLNHLFFPNGGGLDLEDARISNEEGCIELDFQYIEVVKPKRLIFESFDFDPEWNYFRLETNELESSGVYDDENEGVPYHKSHDREEVTELSPGEYVDYDYVENLSYDDYAEIPKNARHVIRWFRGNFVIFCKRSTYNLDTSTYDGRHNKMTTDEFRKYIQDNIDRIKEKDSKKSFIEQVLNPSTYRQRRRRGEFRNKNTND